MSLYYRDSHAAILVFDCTKESTLGSINYWINELDDRINSKEIVLAVACNKYDLYEESDTKVSMEQIDAFIDTIPNKNVKLVKTCAISGENVL